ncbi:hypothetical protein DFP93_103136 [Aneurinibacillus soli]|uniref:Uncharacterized protein n=1 Tax=Aneurinibacillus soli TaxID=1500254 RepID=A0A0U5BFG6_9BACL|nr:hypothetical protein [Aneurinibacillus soli]PYE62926.1 hypothetical protein DFP93_103136 [Aneurinibacillus soli]BAU29015.1 hypothetical protein CB4_03193 [Aneurinibacillus soli]
MKEKVITYLKEQEVPKSREEIAKATGMSDEEIMPTVDELLKAYKIELVGTESEKYVVRQKH